MIAIEVWLDFDVECSGAGEEVSVDIGAVVTLYGHTAHGKDTGVA